MKRDNYTEADLHLAVCFAISLGGHALLLMLFYADLSIKRELPQQELVMTVELLPISEKSNVKEAKTYKAPEVKNEDAKKVEKSKTDIDTQKKPPPVSEPTQQLKGKVDDAPKAEEVQQPQHQDSMTPPAPENPEPQSQTEQSQKQELPQKTEEPQKVAPIKETPKAPVEAPKKQDETKKEKPKPKKQEETNHEEDEIDALLKNLEEPSDGKNAKSQKSNRKKTAAVHDAFGDFDEDVPQSITHDDVIRSQIQKHWNIPAGAAMENIQVKVRILLERNGEVQGLEVIKTSCPPGREIACKAVRDSVMRAIHSAAPLENLQDADYESWKTVTLTFSPKDIGR